MRKGSAHINQLHLLVNFLPNIIFRVLLGVNGPIDIVLEYDSESVVRECRSEIEGVSFFVEAQLIRVGGLHEVYG